MFKKNMGNKERISRLAVGTIAVGLAASRKLPVAANALLGVVGLAGLVTGATQYCPVNQALKSGDPGSRLKAA